MAYAYHHPSNNQELIDPHFIVGFLPRSPGFIYRPILPTVQVLDPRLGVALQCHPSVIIHMDLQRSISLIQVLGSPIFYLLYFLLSGHFLIEAYGVVDLGILGCLSSWQKKGWCHHLKRIKRGKLLLKSLRRYPSLWPFLFALFCCLS